MARRILIVEDERAFADVISELLSEEGYTVVRARETATALNMLASRQVAPEAIICDVMLPGMRGDHFAAEVRRRYPGRRLPIVLLSASTKPRVHLRDVWFMSKPIEIRELLALVGRVIEPAGRGAAAGA
jgi:CheY-like chemotaxis protein